jgi:hypothetical protein
VRCGHGERGYRKGERLTRFFTRFLLASCTQGSALSAQRTTVGRARSAHPRMRSPDEGTTRMNPVKKLALGGAMLAAMGAGGAVGAVLVTPAGAQTAASSSAPNAATSSTGTGSASQSTFPAHGSAAHEDAEKPVTGTTATKAQAAAVKYVGGGTAGAVTTNFTGDGYEVTVTKADGSQVEVHLDSSLNVGGGNFGGGPAGG